MHETVLMQNLIATATQALANHKVARVNCITISVGKLANVMLDSLFFAFEAQTQDGILSGAKLEIENVPAVARCNDCSQEYEFDGFPIVCPACKSTSFMIIGGEEVFLQSIDCEEEQVHDKI